MSVSNTLYAVRVPVRERPATPKGRHAGHTAVSLIVAIMALLAISYFLVPRGQEMAILRLGLGDARGARALLEERLAAGETSPAIIAALARARAFTGDLRGAVALLEPLAQQRPQDIEVVEALVAYQREAGNDQAGLLRAITMLQAVQPSVRQQREIAFLHGMLGQRVEQRAALHRLLAAGPGEVADYLALARLEADAGSPAAALAVLQRLAREHPHAYDVHAAALAAALHVQAGEPEAALVAARSWLRTRDARAATLAATTLASALGAARRPDLVVALLEPLASSAAPSSLIVMLAQAEIDAGRGEAALGRLEALPQGQAVDALETRVLRLRLAVSLGALDRATDAAVLMRVRDAPPPLIATLSMAALDADRVDLLQRLLGWGGADLLRADAALAAEVSLRLGDEASAQRWSASVPNAAEAFTDPRRGLRFAGVLVRLEQQQRAMATFAHLLGQPQMTPDMLAATARAMLGASRAEEAAALLQQRRHLTPSAAAEGAWALVAAAAPAQQAAVAAWLATAVDLAPFPGFLRDLMHVAADAGARDVAISAAQHLVAREGRHDDRRLLAHMMVDARRPVEALDLLRVLRGGGVDVAALHETALTAAWQQGAPVADELRSFWSARLAAADTMEARDVAMAMLTALGAERETLPVLRQRAMEDPARWLWAYGEAARRAGVAAEATALWASLSVLPSLPVELRRWMAFGLLERGARPAAIAAFRELAETAAPDSADARQLLFLWGARPAPAALAWMEARARRAEAGELAVWMRLLTERGAATRAIAAYRAAPQRGGPGPAREAYLAALATVGDRAGLAAAVREELGRDNAPDRLRQLAAFAGHSGDAALEEQVFHAMVNAGDRTPVMLRRVGLIAFRDGQFAQAERWLAECASANGADAQTYFTLGEIRLRQRDAVGARLHFEDALRRVEASGDASVGARKLRATLLRRLGRGREALPIYEALLAAAPSDNHLRADFVSLLMDMRDFQRAGLVLGAR